MEYNAFEAKRVADSFSSSKLGYYHFKGVTLLEEKIKAESDIGGYRVVFDIRDLLLPEDYGAVHARRLIELIKDSLIKDIKESGYEIYHGPDLYNSSFTVSWE